MSKLKRRGSVWYLRTWINGRERFLSTKQKDYNAARRRASEIERDLWDGALGWSSATTTVKAWADKYQKTYSVRKKDAARDVQILAPFVETYGHRRLDSITRSDCVAHVNARHAATVLRKDPKNPKKLAPKALASGTIAREQGTLAALFQRAVEEGLIKVNPWKGVKRPRYEARTRVLGDAEQARYFRALNPAYKRMATVLLGTGLREGELLGLRPDAVDRKGMLLSVRADTAKGGKFRVVPVLPEVLAALDKQWSDDALPYWSLTPKAVTRALSRAARRAGLPHLTPHDLRRTFATRCARAGMAPKILQDIMGHSSIETTMKYYAHIDQADRARALQAVDLGLAAKHGKVIKFRKGRT